MSNEKFLAFFISKLGSIQSKQASLIAVFLLNQINVNVRLFNVQKQSSPCFLTLRVISAGLGQSFAEKLHSK